MNNIVDGPVLDDNGLKHFFEKIINNFQSKDKDITQKYGELYISKFNYPIYKKINPTIIYNAELNNITGVLNESYEKYKEIILYTETGNVDLKLTGSSWSSNYNIERFGGNSIIKIGEGFHAVNLNFNSKIAIIKNYK